MLVVEQELKKNKEKFQVPIRQKCPPFKQEVDN